MGKLKGDDLAYIYLHMKNNYKQLARKDRLWFAFSNKEEGKKGHDILKKVYKDEYKSTGDNWFWTDFNIQFVSQQAAEWVLADIRDSLEAYQEYHPDSEMGEEGGGGTSTSANNSNPDVSDEQKKGTGWTVYIIIGAAAIIIALLLWDKKKK